jgi:hypothetical protein
VIIIIADTAYKQDTVSLAEVGDGDGNGNGDRNLEKQRTTKMELSP